MDEGRTAVYAAEIAAFDGTDLESVRPVGAIISVIESVVNDAWWSGPEVRAVPMRSDAESSCARLVEGRVEIRIATPQATWATAAHELAHALAGIDAGHGQLYRRAMLDVVEVVTNTAIRERRGRLHASQLAEAYRSAGLTVGGRRWDEPDAGAPFAL